MPSSIRWPRPVGTRAASPAAWRAGANVQHWQLCARLRARPTHWPAGRPTVTALRVGSREKKALAGHQLICQQAVAQRPQKGEFQFARGEERALFAVVVAGELLSFRLRHLPRVFLSLSLFACLPRAALFASRAGRQSAIETTGAPTSTTPDELQVGATRPPRSPEHEVDLRTCAGRAAHCRLIILRSLWRRRQRNGQETFACLKSWPKDRKFALLPFARALAVAHSGWLVPSRRPSNGNSTAAATATSPRRPVNELMINERRLIARSLGRLGSAGRWRGTWTTARKSCERALMGSPLKFGQN